MIVALAMAALLIDRQLGPRDRRVADMLQLTIDLGPAVSPNERAMTIARFERDAARIRSCADAERLAARYDREKLFVAGVVTRANHPVGWMPPHLRDQLDTLPTGHATTVYAKDERPRVLVACTTPTLPPDGTSPPSE